MSHLARKVSSYVQSYFLENVFAVWSFVVGCSEATKPMDKAKDAAGAAAKAPRRSRACRAAKSC